MNELDQCRIDGNKLIQLKEQKVSIEGSVWQAYTSVACICMENMDICINHMAYYMYELIIL